MIYELEDTLIVTKLFEGWQETMVYSCLQKVMGKVFVTNTDYPKSVCAYAGCFAFYAGAPDKELVGNKPDGFVIMVPRNKAWEDCIEECFPEAKKVTRYAIKKEKDICILAHAYQDHELWEIADYMGDSYGLSLQAQKAPQARGGPFGEETARDAAGGARGAVQVQEGDQGEDAGPERDGAEVAVDERGDRRRRAPGGAVGHVRRRS